MFLTIPIIEYNEEAEDFVGEEETIDINPMHIAAITRWKNRGQCMVYLSSDESFLVRMPRSKLKEKLNEWLRDNILSKIYKEIKDQSN
jgi:hypothetical protein